MVGQTPVIRDVEDDLSLILIVGERCLASVDVIST